MIHFLLQQNLVNEEDQGPYLAALEVTQRAYPDRMSWSQVKLVPFAGTIEPERDYGPWNCEWATRQTQSRNRGTYNKCSLALAELIRKQYATGKYYQKEIGKRYGLTQAHISQIVRNICWKGEA